MGGESVKKLLCILTAFCVLFALCGCEKLDKTGSSYSDGTEGSPNPTDYTMHLLYNETDSFNPYAVTTKENKEICYLIYDSLITLDSDFEPVYKIASSVETVGKICTVKIKNVLFSDGTTLSANDVVYSLNLAKSSSVGYAAQLTTVESATAVSADTVEIKLTKADPFFANLLDFPIIKSGSENRKSEDNISLPPIGAGRYVLNDGKNILTLNQNYYGTLSAVRKIELINAPGSESINHYVSAGVVSVCYSDYSDNTMLRMSGIKVNVPLNNMVYIGINMAKPLLKEQHLRYALSSAVDRSELVKEAYYGNGTPANGPFNPLWKHSSGFQTLEKKSNKEISIVNLEKIGYNSVDSEGYRINSSGKRISLSLLINSDNSARVAAAKLISTSLSNVGIEIKIDSVDYDTYISRLQSGDFDLYLGEVKLLSNMDITQLVTPGGSAAYGIVYDQPADTTSGTDDTDETPDQTDDTVQTGITLTTADAVAGYYGGTYSLGDVASAFLSEMPLIPLIYRSGVAMFTPDMTSAPRVSISDLFIDINNYSFNK